MAQYAVTTKVYNNGCAEIGDDEQNRKDAVIEKARAHVDLIRLLIDSFERIVHVLLLPEVLCHRDTANDLLHICINACTRTLRTLR